MLRLTQDQALCAKLGEAARRHVIERFSVSAYLRAFQGVYSELLGESRLGEPSGGARRAAGEEGPSAVEGAPEEGSQHAF
jgi:hypothetical protein